MRTFLNRKLKHVPIIKDSDTSNLGVGSAFAERSLRGPVLMNGFRKKFASGLWRYAEEVNGRSLYVLRDRELLFDEMGDLVHAISLLYLGESFEAVAAIGEGFLSMAGAVLLREFGSAEVVQIALDSYRAVTV